MTRTKPAEQRRAELLAAGRTLFLAKGIAATSLDDITRRAGVSKMNNKIVWEAAWMVWRLRLMDVLGQTACLLLNP